MLAVAPRARPSWSHGFARSAAESAYPLLWQGLLGAWVPAFGPTGSRVVDVSGYGNGGTLTNMDVASDWVVTGDPRVPGYALDLDGTNDYVDCGTSDLLDLPGDSSFTLAATVLLHAFTLNEFVQPAGIRNGSNGSGFWLEIGNDGGFQYIAILVYDEAGAELYGAPASSGFATEVWMHLHGIIDMVNGVAALYIDGIDRSGDVEVPPTWTQAGTASFMIGRNPRDNHYLNGQIASVKLWNRVLTPQEIAIDANVPFAPFQLRRKMWGFAPAVGGAAPKGIFGLPFFGPFGGPI